MKIKEVNKVMELEQLKNYVIDSYCSLNIHYNDGMGSVTEYGEFCSKCAEAKILYKMASELGVEDQLVEPPEEEEEWDFWSGVEGVQYVSRDSYVSEDEPDDLVDVLGELPETVDDEDDE